MNYIAEINAFEQWLETHYLPISSQLLWYKIISICNKSGWSEWVTVDNLRLMAAMQMSREATLIKARDELIKAGLINYQKGRKGHPNKYQVISFTTLYTCKSEVERVVESEVERVVEKVVESEVERVDIYKHKQNEINKKNDTDVSSENRLSYKRILNSYHAICIDLPKIQCISDERKRKIKILLQELKKIKELKEKDSYEQLEWLFHCVQESDFLCGRSSKWKCSFDWILNKTNALKILEGNYKNKKEASVEYANNTTNDRTSFEVYDSEAFEREAIERFRSLQMQKM